MRASALSALSALTGLCLIPGAALAAEPGMQPIDATALMQCVEGGTGAPADDISVHVIGTASASLAQTRSAVFEWTSTTIQSFDRGASPAAGTQIVGHALQFDAAIQGATNVSRSKIGPYDLSSPPYATEGPGTAYRAEHTGGGYGPFAVTFPAPPPLPPPMAGATGLTVTPDVLMYSAAVDGPNAQPSIADRKTCTVKPGQPALVTIPTVDAPTPTATPTMTPTPTPIVLPAVTRVVGSAWAGIGGLLRVHGSLLKGAKLVTVGPRSVRPLLVIGSSDVWVLAPALPKGDYPVTVRTAASTSPAATPATIRYR